jgi:hypothetical protein
MRKESESDPVQQYDGVNGQDANLDLEDFGEVLVSEVGHPLVDEVEVETDKLAEEQVGFMEVLNYVFVVQYSSPMLLLLFLLPPSLHLHQFSNFVLGLFLHVFNLFLGLHLVPALGQASSHIVFVEPAVEDEGVKEVEGALQLAVTGDRLTQKRTLFFPAIFELLQQGGI